MTEDDPKRLLDKRTLLPITRTVRALRRAGWAAEACETQIPGTLRKRDLFGFADVIAIKPGEAVLLVQATDSTHVANRRTKTCGVPEAKLALDSGVRVEVWGWSKTADEPRVVALERSDFCGTAG